MSSKGKTIIVADDHETSVMYLAIVLRRMGFSVLAARNGQDVLDICATTTPDLLFTDRKMPIMDGVTMLKAMKADPRLAGIPAVLVTAYCEQRIFDEWLDLGGAGVLTKPIKISELHRQLQEQIDYSENAIRKNLRFLYSGKVRVCTKGTCEEYYSVTLSEGGVFLRTSHPLPTGSRVQICLEMHPGQVLAAAGTVIYHKNVFSNDLFCLDPGMAVKFDELPQAEADNLRSYILEMLAGDLLAEQRESVLSARDIPHKPLPERLLAARQAWHDTGCFLCAKK